ncbi:MAG: tyrosine-protein phosphatase, partial [Dehalococcoidales bacterium]|nr:tyrosine-protein phosphatase [Dehalococcoidales bacterium]
MPTGAVKKDTERKQMNTPHRREIEFERIINFRDLGGYRTEDGSTVAWRRIFRSGTLHGMTANDLARLRELGLKTILDLRSDWEVERRGRETLLQSGFCYRCVPFAPDDEFQGHGMPTFDGFPGMGEFYVHLIRQEWFGRRIVTALETIARKENLPLVFHCAAGKDRTGILAGILLSVLGVPDEDVAKDYALSTPHIQRLLGRLQHEARMPDEFRKLPEFFWQTPPESMLMLLRAIRDGYGSAAGYLLRSGATPSLIG